MKKIYFNIAFTNILKNKKNYFPYILVCIISIASFASLQSIYCFISSENINYINDIITLLKTASVLIFIMSAVILFYTNSFLMKSRGKEIGIYSALGMEKKHIGTVLFFESVITFLISCIAGIIVGLVLSRGIFQVLLNLLKIDNIFEREFSISFKAAGKTVISFILIFAALLIKNLNILKKNNPINLLKKNEEGEKEPKANILIAVVSLALIIAAYCLTITMDDPMEIFKKAKIILICVIAGTYGIFLSVSIFVLKKLKKIRNFIIILKILFPFQECYTE